MMSSTITRITTRHSKEENQELHLPKTDSQSVTHEHHTLKHLFTNTHLFLRTCQAASISAYRFFSDGFPVLTP